MSEKFAKQHQWQLVHQWLGAGLEQKLGLSSQQWETFVGILTHRTATATLPVENCPPK